MAAYLPAVFFRNWKRSYDELESVQISVPVEDEGRALCGLLSFLDLLLFLESDAASHLSTHSGPLTAQQGQKRVQNRDRESYFLPDLAKCLNVLMLSFFLIF